jgi:hypothetical protein
VETQIIVITKNANCNTVTGLNLKLALGADELKNKDDEKLLEKIE